MYVRAASFMLCTACQPPNAKTAAIITAKISSRFFVNSKLRVVLFVPSE